MRHVFKCTNVSSSDQSIECLGETERQWDGEINETLLEGQNGMEQTVFMFSQCDNSKEQCDKNVWWLCDDKDEHCVDPEETPKLWCGLGYEGPLCSQCEDGYGRSGIARNNACTLCGWFMKTFGYYVLVLAGIILIYMLHYLIGWFAVTKADLAPTKARIGIALVICNSDYGNQQDSWPELPAAEADSKLIVTKLRLYGYDVIHVVNGTKKVMDDAIKSFKLKLKNESKYQPYKQTHPGLAPGEVAALIFYVGHGCQVDGENFLVPSNHTDRHQHNHLIPVDDVLKAARPKGRKGPTICILDASHPKERGPLVPMKDGSKKDMFHCPLSKGVMLDPVYLNADPPDSDKHLKASAEAGEHMKGVIDQGWCYERSALIDYCKRTKKASNGAIVGNPRTGEPIECKYIASEDRLVLDITPHEERRQHILEWTHQSALSPIDEDSLDPDTVVVLATEPNQFAPTTSTEDENDFNFHAGRPYEPSRGYPRTFATMLTMRRGVDEVLSLIATRVSAKTRNLQLPQRTGQLSIRETEYWVLNKNGDGSLVRKRWTNGFIINGKLPVDPTRAGGVQYSLPDDEDEEEYGNQVVDGADGGIDGEDVDFGRSTFAAAMNSGISFLSTLVPSFRIALGMIQIMSGMQFAFSIQF
eukprot:COSAG02_NODE_2487_length_8704_cov_24.065311_1_plen_642_part_10